MKDFITPKEAMQLLQVSKPTVYRYISAGKLKAVRLINKTFISLASATELNTIKPIN